MTDSPASHATGPPDKPVRGAVTTGGTVPVANVTGPGPAIAVTGGQGKVWGTNNLPAVEVDGALAGQDALIREELERLRAQGIFTQLAEGLPDGSAQKRLLLRISESFGLQLVLASFGYLAISIGFRLLVPPEVGAYEGLNFLLFLYLLFGAAYFARYDVPRAGFASLVLLIAATMAYAARLTGFRPSLYFLVTHPMLTLGINLLYSSYLEAAAKKGILALTSRRELMQMEQQKRGAGQKDDDVLKRMKEADVRSVQIKTNFSDVLNTLRDLGSSIRESDIYETIFRLLHRGTEAQAAELWFLSDDGKSLKVEEARQSAGKTMMASEFQMTLPHDDTSLVSMCARRMQALLPDSIASDGILRDLQKKSPHPTVLALPIMVDGRVKAVLNVSRGSTALEPHQIALLHTVSQVGARAFETARTFSLSEAERKAAVNLSQQERAERVKTRETLERFVSRNVIDVVMENPNLSQNMEVTVLLADLRGFTAISEKLPPEVVVEMLNDYFGSLTPLVFKYQGTLDKYIGDMIMALFGPPRPTGRDAEAAARCALEMRYAFDHQFKRKWEPRINHVLDLGIALNTGPATVGLLGSDKQVNYTAIGDTVNTASRLEDVTPGGRILCTEATYEKIGHAIELALAGAKSFKGKTEKTRIFEIRGLRSASGSIKTARPATGPSPAARPVAGIQASTSQSASLSQSRPEVPLAPARPQAPAARPPDPEPGHACPLCQSPVPASAQNCPTCGMKL